MYSIILAVKCKNNQQHSALNTVTIVMVSGFVWSQDCYGLSLVILSRLLRSQDCYGLRTVMVSGLHAMVSGLVWSRTCYAVKGTE